MEKILSIIIPTYNMQEYLRKGLESLIISNIIDLLEVIVVNDGSKDKSSEIAHEYAKAYPDTFIVIDKSNGNYGSCINAALKVVRGKYVRILDADDSYITANFEGFVNLLKGVDVDLFFSDYIKYYGEGDEEYFGFDLPVGKVLKAESYYDSNAFREIQLPAITYRTAIFKNINYHQTEGISYTDMEWCFTPVSKVKTIYYYDKPIYNYLLARAGQTMDTTVQVRRFSHVIQSLTNILDTYRQLEVDDNTRDYLCKQILRHLLYVYRFYLVEHKEVDRVCLRAFDRKVHECCSEAYNTSGLFEYRKRIPYHYVSEWRSGKNEYIPKWILVKERIFDFIGRMHVKIMNSKNIR